MQQESNYSDNSNQCCQKSQKPLVKRKTYFFILVMLGSVWLVPPIDEWIIHINAQINVPDKHHFELDVQHPKPKLDPSKSKKK